MNEPETIRHILENTQTIAVVGLSGNPDRPSFSVSQYMQRQGYRILPINPGISEVMGERAYPSLDAALTAEGRIDLVNVFRASEYVSAIVQDVIRLGIPYLWLQQGVRDEQATSLAEAHGIKVVMDRCIYLEHSR